ncbi:MAG: hypothetical protein GY847_39550 [Proteobacteria bacterium]|nr:hypothetical protein [Pseudomonadota bacterium]
MKIPTIVSLITVFVLLTATPGSSFATDEDRQPLAVEETTSKSTKAPVEESPAEESSDAERFYRPNQSPYKVNLLLDLGVIVVGTVTMSVPRIMVNEGDGPWCGLECNLDDVNAFDRATMSMPSTERRCQRAPRPRATSPTT